MTEESFETLVHNKDNNLTKSFLQWNEVTISTKDGGRIILDNLSGEIASGQSLAIMGASGAGKTTFLNYLSKKSATNTGLKNARGSFRIIKNGIDESKSFTTLAGFVTQDDILFEVLTPFELLTFAADLKLVNKTKLEKKEAVENLIARLDLEKCRNTKVGSVLVKGLSGGEKKRTAIGYELIKDPLVLFLDEPTTGLDSISACKIISLITQDAIENKRIVIFTIHQPKTEIFNLFDQYLILAQGKSMYLGSAKDAISYFSRTGYQCPENFNPAEYYIKIFSKQAKVVEKVDVSLTWKKSFRKISDKSFQGRISGEFNNLDKSGLSDTLRDISCNILDKDIDDEYQKVIEKFETTARSNLKLTDFSDVPVSSKRLKRLSNNFFVEFAILMKRNLRIMLLDFKYLFVRLLFSVVSLLLVILIFNSVGLGENAVQDRNGVLFFIVLNVIQANLQTSLQVFTDEKPKFYKEQENKMYSIASYYLSKTVMEIPIQILLALINFLGIYFITALNSTSFDHYLIYILTIFLAGYSGSSMGYLISAIIDSKAILPVVFPFVILTQIQASGYFVNSKDIPFLLKPFKYISIFGYGYQALCWNEYNGYTAESLECTDEYKCKFPTLEFSEGLFWSLMLIFIISIVSNILAYISLIIKTNARKNK